MFSLVDAFVASVILATGLLSLAQLLAMATTATAAAGRATHAVLLAAQKVEELRAPVSPLLQGELSDRPEPGFTRSWSVTPLPADPNHVVVIEVMVTAATSKTRLLAVKARPPGFSLIELMIATLITAMVLGAILAVINPAQALVRAQGDAADLHQRLRAAADALTGGVRTASGVRPYRIGAVRDDGVAGIYFRPDAITVIQEDTRTYYLKAESRELMMYDGGASDLPMVEHVTGLAFDYFGLADGETSVLVRLEPAVLVDGPWAEDATGRRFDEDVDRIREVRAWLRFESTARSLRRLVPDEEIVIGVALRSVIAE